MEQILSLYAHGVASEVGTGNLGEKSPNFARLLRKFCTDMLDGNMERHMYRSQLVRSLTDNLAGGDSGKLRAIFCKNATLLEQSSDLDSDERRELSAFLEEFRKIARGEENLARFLFPVEILKE